MDGLKYFIGKVCTIFVDPINQPLNEEKIINYFVGRVIEIDSRGVTLEHLSTKCRTYFMLNKITAPYSASPTNKISRYTKTPSG